jgi:hypothetical protein
MRAGSIEAARRGSPLLTRGNGGSVTVKAGSLLIDGSGTTRATGIAAETQAHSGGGDPGSVSVDVAGAAELSAGP